MANNVIAQVLGGKKEVLDNVDSVAAVKSQLGQKIGQDLTNYTASLNGEPASNTDSVSDGDFVSLSQAVKGGC